MATATVPLALPRQHAAPSGCASPATSTARWNALQPAPSERLDPALYARFEDERTRSVAKLLARVPLDAPRNVVDLGCGPGNSTELLVQRFPSAHTVGTDSSQAMLAEACQRLSQASAVAHNGLVPSSGL